MLEPDRSGKPVNADEIPDTPHAEDVRNVVEDSASVEPALAPPPPASAEENPLEASISASCARARVGYFAIYAGLSASPYYGLLLEHRGFTPLAIGVLIAFMPFSVIILLSPLSYLADRYHCAMSIHLCASTVSALLLLFVIPSTSHFLIAGLMMLHFAFRVPVGPFMDQRTMSILPPDRKTEWGKMRSYGAYGWAFGALTISALINRSDWWGLAVIYCLGMATAMYIGFTIVPHDETERFQRKFVDVLRHVLSHRRLLVFLITLCFMGMGYAIINTFLFIFLYSIDAPTILLGLSVIMTVVVEIPLFRSSKHVHEYFTDRQLLCMSIFVWAVRVTGYSFLYNPWFVLCLEPLHGLTFGFMWLSGMHFVRRAFPKSLSHSSIGFLSATAFGVGPLVGNIVGGSLYQYLGARWMFRFMALCMICISVVFLLLDRQLEHLGYSVEVEEEGEMKAKDVVVETSLSTATAAAAVEVDRETRE
ncbi:MFS transporter, PPP family, 3-phenylpropionic acid transporter [Trypanosoma cruzi]|nr:MFS transporter, PPP family, 3-phenylpropionic acid transporter [Trypanosoma cruzi]